MSLKIITKDERLKIQTGITVVVVGPAGIGKTSLVKTIDKSVIFINIEDGMASLRDWKGEHIDAKTWNKLRDIACILGGPNPAVRPDQPYSQKHYEYVCDRDKDTVQKLSRYQCIFFDSLSFASKLCSTWAHSHPDVFSEKTGKPNGLAAFGKLGQEMIDWLIQLQHIKDKDIILTAGLEKNLDEFNRPIWSIQCEGNKATNAIPGIVDEVISMVGLKNNEGKVVRSFVCCTLNPEELPAKDRIGCLSMVEEAHLGKLLTKIKNHTVSTELTV